MNGGLLLGSSLALIAFILMLIAYRRRDSQPKRLILTACGFILAATVIFFVVLVA